MSAEALGAMPLSAAPLGAAPLGAAPLGAEALGAAPPSGGPVDPTPTAREDVPVPASHVDLFERPVHAVLTTLMRDGQPRSSLVWVDYDGSCARVNTTLERRKGRDIAADPRVSLLVVDPEDTSRYVQVRGTVELVRDGAEAHLDALTRRFTDAPAFYGHVYPAEQRDRERRVVARVHAHRVTLDAIHR